MEIKFFSHEKCYCENINIGVITHTTLRYDNVFALWTSKIVVEKFKCLKALKDDQN